MAQKRECSPTGRAYHAVAIAVPKQANLKSLTGLNGMWCPGAESNHAVCALTGGCPCYIKTSRCFPANSSECGATNSAPVTLHSRLSGALILRCYSCIVLLYFHSGRDGPAALLRRVPLRPNGQNRGAGKDEEIDGPFASRCLGSWRHCPDAFALLFTKRTVSADVASARFVSPSGAPALAREHALTSGFSSAAVFNDTGLAFA